MKCTYKQIYNFLLLRKLLNEIYIFFIKFIIYYYLLLNVNALSKIKAKAQFKTILNNICLSCIFQLFISFYSKQIHIAVDNFKFLNRSRVLLIFGFKDNYFHRLFKSLQWHHVISLFNFMFKLIFISTYYFIIYFVCINLNFFQ